MLESAWQQRVVFLDVAGQSIVVGPADLGLYLHANATVDQAYRSSRTRRHLKDLMAGEAYLVIRPTLWLDTEVAHRYLQSLRSQVDVPATDATVEMVAGRARSTPSQVGRSLDVASTVAWIEQHAYDIAAGQRVTAAIAPVPPIVSDASTLVDEINRWRDHSLVVQVYDPVSGETVGWRVDPETWGSWVSVTVESVQSGVWDWQLDRQQVRSYLVEQSLSLGPIRYVQLEPATVAVEEAFSDATWQASLRIYHTGQQHRVRLGETIASIARDYGIPYPWVEQANPGVGDSLREGQVISIPSPDLLFPVPIVEHKRIVVSISEQRMWAYENAALLWAWPVSTGIASSPTSPGVFQVLSHEPNAYAASWDLWMPYFLGIYRPVPTSGFMNGFHGFPTRDGSSLLWTGNLGNPVTFGCILLSTENARVLYEWAEEGVIVEIRP